jgi:hypothetical protein
MNVNIRLSSPFKGEFTVEEFVRLMLGYQR